MKNFILIIFLSFISFVNILQASYIGTCKNYQGFSENPRGKSPPVNMLIKSLQGYKFKNKISKKSELFKKLDSLEELAKNKTDLLIFWSSSSKLANFSTLAKKLKKLNISTCSLDLSSISSYPRAYKILGKIFKKEKRANELASFIEEKLKLLNKYKNKVPKSKRLNVYFAKENDGLGSVCKDSIHSEAINLIGAKNPIKCPKLKNMKIRINYENLLLINPDIIITANKTFYKNFFKQNKYKFLKARKNKKIFLIPLKPINYLDSPPSFFKILGVFWLGKKVYPKYFDYDYEKIKKDFDKLFLKA